MNLELNRAIRRILMVGAATALTVGTIGMAHAITAGVQTTPPGPGQVPDYFGVSSNYATSSAPSFATVTITDPGLPSAVPAVPGGTGAIAAATTVDYLSPNYALTPIGMYSKNLMDVQLVTGGANYSAATTVTVTGSNGTDTLTPIIVNGVIAGFVEIPHGDIKDALGNTVANGAAWPKDANTGQWLYPSGTWTGLAWAGLGVDPNGTIAAPNKYSAPLAGTGIRKFLNTLSVPGVTNELGQTLTIADATINSSKFVDVTDAAGKILTPAADYYEIAEVAYIQQMHSDLPPTHLRGYIQLVPSTMVGAVDITTLPNIQTSAPAGTYFVKPGTTNASYLGPVIVAQKDKPVRIKAVNLLPINSLTPHGSELPFPVDHTYMGAGQQDATGAYVADEEDTRTAIHLHGGTTPWISDGTPRQWFKPAGETGANKGISATNVPDMWFDVNGDLVPNSATCTQGSTVCTTPGATNNPGDGALTFYYTNEQSARLMFYHDHAEGITRLNVYSGLAAGYILQDPTEKAMTHGNAAAGGSSTVGATTYAEVLPEDEIPLVIQEKTFVPDNKNPVMTFYGPFRSQLNAQDPTWRWGTMGAGNPQGSWDGVTNGPILAGQFDPLTVIGNNGPGDLWAPHVYMTNQNPGDATGANPQGRWDYGPWFWPIFSNIQHSQVTNPYFDSTCNSVTAANNPVGTCEFQYIPGFPNGGQMPANTTAVNCQMIQNGTGTSVKSCTPTGNVSPAELAAMGQSAGTPEAFNDTAMVNGTVYPFMQVEPKKYRLRLLTAGNDRSWNLSLWVASRNDVDTTAGGNTGSTAGKASSLCYGGANTDLGKVGLPATAAAAPLCTEVRMVPFDVTQNTYSKFPAWWYSTLKGGITFDGRPSGVPDPTTRGPAMVQIGTEGGFLAEPAVIKNQPVNFEYNVKNILVTNVKEHALLLGAAERADVVVDFSQFAGSTLIMYNDAPAPQPAFDLRLDYYTGNFDNTDTGGTFQTVPGYGPNTRTVMQFRVASSCTSANCGTGINRAPSTTAHPVDDVDTAWLANLTTEVRKAFKYSQEPIVVPQAAYNNVYQTNVTDAQGTNLSSIGDTALSFTPLTYDATGNLVLSGAPVSLGLGPKAIQELFTLDYGRMNATLGVEIPNTTATVQTTIPMGYVEPPTELVQITKEQSLGSTPIGQLSDGTQIWKITHNGVDTHPVHFHLFSVQLVNRVGWDGAVYPPEPNEVGWKEVVRMNPLSDVIVALRPKTLTLPFKLGNSKHLADSTQPNGSTANQPNLSPLGGRSTIVNRVLNYGWEYVWHCHILGHEENDFMRSIAVAVPPEDPSALTVTADPAANFKGNTLNWADNSMVSNWAMITRATDAGFTQNVTTFPVAYADCTLQAGCARSYKDTSAKLNTTYFYRVASNSTVGAGDANAKLPATLNKANILPTDNAGTVGAGFLGYDNVTASSNGFASNSVTYNPVASWSNVSVVTATTANFGDLAVGATAPQTLTLYNTGSGVLSISSITTSGAPYTVTGGTCSSATPVNPAASCTVIVSFAPTAAGLATGTLTINDNSGNVASAQTATLTGNGISAPLTLSSNALTFNVYNPTASTTSTTASTPATQTVTVTNASAAPVAVTPVLTGTGFTAAAGSTCSALTPVAAGGTCTYNIAYIASTTNSNLNALGKLGNTGKVTFTSGAYSTVVNLTGNAAPKAPTNLARSAVAANSLTLKWTAPANTVASYSVMQATTAAGPWTPATGTITGTSMAVTGLVGNTTYYFRVAANNAAGQGAFTTTVNATTPRALPTAISAVSGLAAPADAIITAGLNWTANNAGTTYQVRYANNAAMTSGLVTVNNAVSGQQINVGGVKRIVYMQVRITNGTWSPVSALAAQAQ